MLEPTYVTPPQPTSSTHRHSQSLPASSIGPIRLPLLPPRPDGTPQPGHAWGEPAAPDAGHPQLAAAVAPHLAGARLSEAPPDAVAEVADREPVEGDVLGQMEA